ncbi:shikimate kinase [Thermoleptolyngbya oregonensis NK1-22]|uniref:Shikimate kinase n=1 Tax=Thermoleptolyngbya oregonensis NK1-22 TaxID=2547457 RepID=A0AA96Y7T6_9CYAN|nr:shikimate kinase [Thermoleptolyngbya oregonensis]WOB45321.1 shikimate kinase [Thermoleptolyngbya oregonensis NK1-22]
MNDTPPNGKPTESESLLLHLSTDHTVPADAETTVRRLRRTNLYLVGMMGCGKTTVGRLVAQKLGYQFFDTDTLIETATHQTVAQVFAERGEAGFRDLETQILAELSSYAYGSLAIATGGGVVLRPQNWSYLHHGIVIWLDVPADQLYYRLRHSTTRPLLQDPDPRQRIQELLDQRRSLYAQADVHVQLRGRESPEFVTARVLEAIARAIRPEAEDPEAEAE